MNIRFRYTIKKSVFGLTFSLMSIAVCFTLDSCNETASAQQQQNTKSGSERATDTTTTESQEKNLRIFSKEELLGKLNPARDTGFVKIEPAYTRKPEIYLRKEVYDAFKKMFEAAKKSGIQLNILSATRNFEAQKNIWENKWIDPKYSHLNEKERALQIMKFSSMPGTSRHHWGTDMDFNNLSPSYFETGEGKKIYDWLSKNAGDFGFYQTYTNKANGRTGYEEEKWHWTYLPLSKPMLASYNELITCKDISGFRGSTSAQAVQAIELYVNGIDKSLIDTKQ